MSSSDYDLFAKVKDPLRGTLHNTRDELIRAIGRSIGLRNIKNMDALMVYDALQTFGQKVINKGATILKVQICCTSVYEAMSEITNCIIMLVGWWVEDGAGRATCSLRVDFELQQTSSRAEWLVND